MNKTSSNYLLPKIGQPMLRALKILAPHFKEIGEMWRQLMQNRKPDLEMGEMEELACVTLEAQHATLCAGKAAAYRLALARCGQSLDRRGVPAVHAMIALSLYLESCCALLFNMDIRNTELTMALVRLNSASQWLVIAGYSEQHSTNWLRFIERERHRFSQDLHDEIGHNLVVLKLYIELMAREYKRGHKENIIEKLEEAMTLVSQSISSMRRLVRDLGPAVLDQLGLLPSFKVYARQFSARTGITVQVQGKDIPGLPRVHETALFRVLQGALSNVAKHSKAKRVQITVKTIKGSIIQMTIADNGSGFVTTKPHATQMFGLAAMRERIETLGGQFRLTSRQASSKDRRSGTRIHVDLPLTGVHAGAAA